MPAFKTLLTRQISPVYGISTFTSEFFQRKREKKKKGTRKSLLCVLVPVSWDGLSWEDCVGLRPGTYRIVTPKGWKRNAPVAERRKNMGADEDKSGHGERMGSC